MIVFSIPESGIDPELSSFDIEQEFLKFKLNANGKAADTIRTSAIMGSETRIKNHWIYFHLIDCIFSFPEYS